MTNTNQSELTRNDDKTFILRLTIKANDVKSTYQHLLEHIAADIDIHGFRKGKAPKELVEKHISNEKLLEETAQKLIPDLYQQKIKEHVLKPIIQPQIKITNPPLTIDKDWQIEIISCELPEIKLADYSKEITVLNVKNIKLSQEEKVNQILDLLVKKSSVILPPILTEAELNHKLSQLVDQTQQAGITVQAYLKNQNLTLDQYKEQLKSQITKEWTLNLALDSIAHSNKLEVTPQNVEEEMKKYSKNNIDPQFLQFILMQNKTIEYLQSLK